MDASDRPQGVMTTDDGAKIVPDSGSAKPREKTPVWRRGFLRALAISGSVTKSCKAAGIDQSYVYWLRARKPRFARAWERAMVAASRRKADRIEAEAYRRAVDGWLEPVFQKGECVGHRRRYSDALLAKVLEAEKPEKYRKNHDGPQGNQVNVQVNVQARQQLLLDDPEVAEAHPVPLPGIFGPGIFRRGFSGEDFRGWLPWDFRGGDFRGGDFRDA
jgi:hypothetical protein